MLKMPDDYRQWFIMMVTEFGTRFTKLFRGPGWSGCDKADVNYPIKGKFNVAAMSHVSVTKELRNSPYTTTPEIQIAALKLLKLVNPNGRFWIKLDATDIMAALMESVKGVWSGDCNLLDGALEALRGHYDARLLSLFEFPPDIHKMIRLFKEDYSFLREELEKTVAQLKKRMKEPKTSEETLKQLNWEQVELAQLVHQSAMLIQKYEELEGEEVERQTQVHRGAVEETLKDYYMNLFKKRRKPAATHVLVIMLSDEKRQSKPYALPVQFIPYHSIKDKQIRKFVGDLKAKMKEMDMTCVGTVTDGEFSTLRTADEEGRPTHIYELIRSSRKKVQSKSAATLKKMLVQIGETENGSPLTEKPTDVPEDVIHKLASLQEEGTPWIEALGVVRAELVPPGYTPQKWHPCQFIPESELEMMKSIIATFTFRKLIGDLQRQGTDFNKFLYIPSVDPVTGDVFHEREDHNHVLKRIAKHLRDGGIPGVDLKKFYEAMLDTGNDLTEAALRGDRKQSVGDAERLLSFAVADFFLEKNYIEEEKFVRTVARWHESSDGRGLSQNERREANLQMLEFVKDAWIPWHSTTPGLKYLDINVRLHGVSGFSRETFLGVTSNIESQEHRRTENESHGPEHPRAGTTDDVECFFGLLHRIVKGIHVTLKDFKFWWQKLILQFINRIDPSLPFYVWTLSDRYSLDDVAPFDELPEDQLSDTGARNTRLHRLQVRSREQSSVATQGRNDMPTTHAQSIRQSHFRRPIGLPSVPAEMQEDVQAMMEKN